MKSPPFRKKPAIAVDLVELELVNRFAGLAPGRGFDCTNGDMARMLSFIEKHAAFFVVLQIEHHLAALKKATIMTNAENTLRFVGKYAAAKTLTSGDLEHH